MRLSTTSYAEILRKICACRSLSVSAKTPKDELILAILADNSCHQGQLNDTWLLTEVNDCTEQTRLRMARQQRAEIRGGYVRPPLLTIPFEDVVFDVLHCFLRIWDKVFTLAVQDAALLGRVALSRLQDAIVEAGVPGFEFTIGCTADEKRDC